MRPKWPRRFYFPVARAYFGVAMRVKWVVNAAARACGFAYYQESHLIFRIVQKSMSKSGAGGKRHTVAGLQALQKAIGPQIWLALQHKDEFLLIGLGMRPGDPPAGQQSFMMNAKPHQAECPTERGAD